MARYKHYDLNQTKMIPLSYADQIIERSFEFLSRLEHEIVSLFGAVLLYASALGPIGKEHFAIDGCKLPSNASKKWSGTHKEPEDPSPAGAVNGEVRLSR